MCETSMELIWEDEESLNENIEIHDPSVLNKRCFLVNEIIVDFK